VRVASFVVLSLVTRYLGPTLREIQDHRAASGRGDNAFVHANGLYPYVWNFDYGQTIYSKICSSAYEAFGGQSILVDFAVADNYAHARLVGLDPNHNVVFDFQYATVPCDTSWNAEPIAFDSLSIN